MTEHAASAAQSVAESADQLPPAIRELHRAALRRFCEKGQAHRDDLHASAVALGVDLDEALKQISHRRPRAHRTRWTDRGRLSLFWPAHRPHRPTRRALLCGSDVCDRRARHPVDDRHRRCHRLRRPRLRGTDPRSTPRRRMDVATRHPPPSSSSAALTAAEPWRIPRVGQSPFTPTPSARSHTSTIIPASTASSSARPTPLSSPTKCSDPC